jgi:hypothetical protein
MVRMSLDRCDGLVRPMLVLTLLHAPETQKSKTVYCHRWEKRTDNSTRPFSARSGDQQSLPAFTDHRFDINCKNTFNYRAEEVDFYKKAFQYVLLLQYIMY